MIQIPRYTRKPVADQQRLADRRAADDRAERTEACPMVARVDAAISELEVAADRALLAALERQIAVARARIPA